MPRLEMGFLIQVPISIEQTDVDKFFSVILGNHPVENIAPEQCFLLRYYDLCFQWVVLKLVPLDHEEPKEWYILLLFFWNPGWGFKRIELLLEFWNQVFERVLSLLTEQRSEIFKKFIVVLHYWLLCNFVL